MAVLWEKVANRLRGELALALARTLLARVVAALGTLALALALARAYGTAGVGVFAVAQGLLLGGGILARYGMDNSLMLYAGRGASARQVYIYLGWAGRRAFTIATVLAVVLFLGRQSLADAFGTPALAPVLSGMALALPAFTLAFLLAGLMRGLRRPATASLLENGSVSLVAAVVVVLLQAWQPEAELANAGWAMAVAAWLVLLQGAIQFMRWQPAADAVTAELALRADFDRSSRNFFIASLSVFMQSSLGMVLAGYLMSAHDLGLLKSAQQLAVLISFILMVINAVFPPRFAELYHHGRHQELDRLARQSAVIGLALALPLLLVFLLLPGPVLGLFGPAFTEAALPLQIIALGQLVNVATGSVGFLLNMTGHEALMRNIALGTNALGLLLFFVLIPPLGVVGGALAIAFVLAAQNVIAVWYVWSRLGIWTLPLPNFLSSSKSDQRA